jgi:NADH dehydrogenase [ubiquinone] 1 alpha subcomplex assembly factor 7
MRCRHGFTKSLRLVDTIFTVSSPAIRTPAKVAIPPQSQPLTACGNLGADRIMKERLDHFMARANAAYYATHDPFADFTTAPEISQVFGELLGLWAAVTWQTLGSPVRVSLAEAGPGRGTLMVDAIRAIARAAPAFRAAATVHLIETSPRLRAVQRERIDDAVCHDTIETLPNAPMILLGNEFLDALPIRQFVRRGAGWTERFVGPQGLVEEPTDFFPTIEATEGDVAERCEPAEALAVALAARVVRQPGAALFVDYGPEHSRSGDSLQAIAGGRPADPLGVPGAADLTAHVDFERFAAVARAGGAQVHGPVPQGLFLARLGLFQRTNQLARHLPPRQASAMMEGARRLGEPDRMGRLFKAIALVSPGTQAVPGFE